MPKIVALSSVQLNSIVAIIELKIYKKKMYHRLSQDPTSEPAHSENMLKNVMPFYNLKSI